MWCLGFLLCWLPLLQSTGSRSRASVVTALRLSSCGTWALVTRWHVESFQTRDGTRVPCIGKRILINYTTREVLQLTLNNVGDRGANPLDSQKSVYCFLVSPGIYGSAPGDSANFRLHNTAVFTTEKKNPHVSKWTYVVRTHVQESSEFG